MLSIKHIRMMPKLIGAFLIVGVIPLVIVAFMSISKTTDGMMALSYNQMNAVQAIKAVQVGSFFGERVGDVNVLADNPYTKMAAAELGSAAAGARQRGVTGTGLMQDSEFKAVYDSHFESLNFYMEQYGYFDLFL
ncbi:MAG: hypothetical protein GY863_18030, partial [bacterium]|nr:hypothetical protein [bacterium]